MQLKRSMFTIICTLAVFILCSANTVYAWESLNQSVINNITGEAIQAPDDSEKPDNPSEPDKPDKPSESEKPEDSKKPTVLDKPNKKPGSSSAQNGKADANTGDTHEFLRYLLLMLISFVFMIVIGVFMIVFAINALESHRK